jgi:DNA-binding transcriptional MerR regulator
MEKSPDAFRTISEVADDLDLPQHVLRFWETRFTQIKPLKRGGGRRYYRPQDVELIKGIRHMLYDQGYTIKGVQKLLRDNGNQFLVAIGSGNLAAVEAMMTSLSASPRSSPTGVSSGWESRTMKARFSRTPQSCRGTIAHYCRRRCSTCSNASVCSTRCADQVKRPAGVGLARPAVTRQKREEPRSSSSRPVIGAGIKSGNQAYCNSLCFSLLP